MSLKRQKVAHSLKLPSVERRLRERFCVRSCVGRCERKSGPYPQDSMLKVGGEIQPRSVAQNPLPWSALHHPLNQRLLVETPDPTPG